eukprot:CAMPEP_0181107494 /NCGR_PEP_ID=MMETSP1071-20121207/17117_1 /TAXON_ID=35127 /ORGANISM="Thalassiosira sp., Strain NH16" /LENGTH=425 /DNA_ID=CAMNT_0023191015 /DNA_START=449 /DNA_END=1723 /DNA_ORIENTATION=+
MILSAYMTYMTCIMLCFCSRRGGGSSYGEVVRSAFGERMEETVSWVLVIWLVLALVAYQILIRDIWTPLVKQVVWFDVKGDHVLLGITVLLLPILCQRSLHALRKMCYIGFASILVLCIALCNGGYQKMIDGRSVSKDDFYIEYFKIPSPRDLLFCFPIINTAFVCHFNVIAIQNALSKPTRERMQNLIRYAIASCFLVMYVFGLAGYIYGGNATQGNVLLNVPMKRQDGDYYGYYIFLLGRIGCGITMILVMPMVLLPCREALLEVVDVRFHESHHRSDIGNANAEQCWWKLFHRYNSTESVGDAEIKTEDEILEIQPAAEGPPMGDAGEENPGITPHTVLIRHKSIQKDYVFPNSFAHYGSTLVITVACYLGAVAVTGVATVWSFIGSSLAFFIAFILPCACFIVMENAVPTIAEGGDRNNKW